MTFPRKQLRTPSSYLIPPDGLATQTKLENVEPKAKYIHSDNGFEFTQRRGLAKGFMSTPPVDKTSSSVESSLSPNYFKLDPNDNVNKIMIRKISSQFDNGTDSDFEQRTKLDSSISIMVSTIMCLSAKYPIPRTNIQATKLFLSTIVNDRGETPRNIKGLLALLKAYSGPYEGVTIRTATENSDYEESKTLDYINREMSDIQKNLVQSPRTTVKTKEHSEVMKCIRDPSVIPKPIKDFGETRNTKDRCEISKSSNKESVDTLKSFRESGEAAKQSIPRLARVNISTAPRPRNRFKSASPVKKTGEHRKTWI